MSKQRKPARAEQSFRRDSVIVAYLHPSDHVGARFHRSLVDLLVRDSFAARRVVAGTLDMASGANITTARNSVVRDFLATDAAWLWLIDADMDFAPDTLDRLLRSADPVTRPIVGGLCFRVTQEHDNVLTLTPTLYGTNDDTPPRTVVYHDYPRDAVVAVAATGAACLLVHRSVLEAMESSGRWRKPWTWFAETLYPDYDDVISEDITFCLRAGSLGFPVHVDTSIEIGHQKSFVATAALFESLRPAPAEVPTYVVVPGRDRHAMTRDLLADLAGEGVTVLLYDNGSAPSYRDAVDGGHVEHVDATGWPLHAMWAHGIAEARRRSPVCNVAVLNNDLRVPPGTLGQLARALRAHPDIALAYPNVHGLDLEPGQAQITEGRSMAGFCFMLRGESALDVDQQFGWWYGDSDLEAQARALGKHVVTVGGTAVEHLEPNGSTTGERLGEARLDEKAFAAKWDLDPASLFLARHPDFGADLP
jgi:GT2 family glycosyltransferase